MMGNYYCVYCGKEICYNAFIAYYIPNSPASACISVKYYHPDCFEQAKPIYLTYDV